MRQKLIAVDTISSEFVLYSLRTGGHVRTCTTPPRSRSLPRQVAFGEEGKILVGGTDNGTVCVFDCRTGMQLEIFRPTKGLAQTVHVRMRKLIIYQNSLAAIDTLERWT